MPRVKANDTELYYQEAGTGREPLVLVHGWVSSSRVWVETIPRLPRKRYFVDEDTRRQFEKDPALKQ